MDLRDIRSYNILKTKDSQLASQVETVYNLTFETINGISRFYDNYTMHDMNHGLRVATYMEELAFGLDDFASNIESFNALELALILLSAILHDIGMFVRPEDEEEIRNNRIKYTDSLTFQGVLKVSLNEDEAIKEIIRITHAARINEFINYKFGGKSINEVLLVNGNYPYSEDIVAICRAHGEDYTYLESMRTEVTKGSYTYNPQYIAVLLRIADYLDLDKQRTPILWYSMMGLKGFSREEWEKHFIIQNEKKLRKYIDGKLQIYFDGKSANANIHRKYLKYIDDIKIELENADSLLNTISTNKKYAFNVSTKLDDCVQTEGFKYSNLRLTLDYSAITNLLMGKNIYGDSRLGLRELIQNSIDACKLMQEIKKSDFGAPEPMIRISYSEENNYVKIKDNGIGMSLDVVKKHFLNVGKSYYKSNEYLHKNYEYKPIGQFGIGFLACFLLSDTVTVKTKYYKNNEINQIELEKNSEYVVTNTEQLSYFFGTEIKLDYNGVFKVFSSEDELRNFVEKYFYTSIPIYIKNDDSDEADTLVNNSCQRLIDNIAKDSTKGKYEDINCADYSNVISGHIKIRNTAKEKNNNAMDIVCNKTYVYSPEKQSFELLRKGESIPEGYYTLIKYSNICEEDYSEISKTRRSDARKRAEILALSKERNREIELLISRTNNVDVMPILVDNKPIQVNDAAIDKVLTNSNLKYYSELISDTKCLEEIFVSSMKYAFLQDCDFDGIWRPYRYMSDVENRDFFFYNREILIDHFRGISCAIPCALEAIGYINYTGSYIKLDVSRNSVISGYKELQWEMSLVLLKHIKAVKEPNEDLQVVINGMIEYLNKRLEITKTQAN